ncbi:MAG: hypothetical protein IJ302_04870, partial [Clostridia bacterium]|nr:hypothetical protein [Clostridia bacterium]
KRKVTSSFISFTIAPRINAIGRIYSASRAVELFLTDSPEHANRLANELCDANRERQETENRIAYEAFEQVEREHDIGLEHILVLAGEGWHHGVIGIVASRVTEKYHLPCILFSYEAENGEPAPTDEGKGSGRSVEGFCMIDALVECQDLLVRFGGHAQAAGMTVTRADLPEFRRRMEECAARAFSEGVPPPTLTVDCETDFSDITLRTAEALYQLEPYGCANPQPLFCLYRVKIENITALSLGKHTRLTISDPENDAVTRCAMVFGVRTEQFPYRTGDIVDLVYSMDVNEFRGERSVQMLVQDIRPHTPGNTFCDRQMAVYDQCMRGIPAVTEDCAFPQDMIPTREDCKAVWLLLRTQTDAGAKDAAVTYNQLSFHTGLSVCKVRMICDTLEETTLIRRSRSVEGGFTCTLDTTGKKIDLTRAPLLMRLCEMYR